MLPFDPYASRLLIDESLPPGGQTSTNVAHARLRTSPDRETRADSATRLGSQAVRDRLWRARDRRSVLDELFERLKDWNIEGCPSSPPPPIDGNRLNPAGVVQRTEEPTMTQSSSLQSRLAAATVLIAALVVPVSRASASTGVPARGEQPVIEVTAQDVAASNKKIAMAYSALLVDVDERLPADRRTVRRAADRALSRRGVHAVRAHQSEQRRVLPAEQRDLLR